MTTPSEQVTVSGDTIRVHVEFEVQGSSRFRDALVMTQAEYTAYSKKSKAQRDALKRARYDDFQRTAREAIAENAAREQELAPAEEA